MTVDQVAPRLYRANDPLIIELFENHGMAS